MAWDRLINDPDIPAASFLYYERCTALTRLIDVAAGHPPFDDADLTTVVAKVIPPATSV